MFLKNGVARGLCRFLKFSGLYGKIALCKCDFFLFWITILSDEIAGIPCQHIILDRSLRSTAQGNHFRDLTKMVRYFDSTFPILSDTNNDICKRTDGFIVCVPFWASPRNLPPWMILKSVSSKIQQNHWKRLQNHFFLSLVQCKIIFMKIQHTFVPQLA